MTPLIEYRPGVNIQWIFRWIMTLLSCWILITLLNSDTFLSRNSTGRRYIHGSEFHVELWPWVKIPRWIMTPGHNSTLNCDPNPRSQFNLGSQFNVKSRPGVTIQHGIMTRVKIQREILIRSQFNVESWPGVTIQRWVMTRGHNSTWNYDPGSKFHVELWSGSSFQIELWSNSNVTIEHLIMSRGHNSTWN